MKSMFKNFFRDPNERYLKKLEPIVKDINALEKKFEGFSDEELRNMTEKFKQRLSGESLPTAPALRGRRRGGREGRTPEIALDDILSEVFAVVREAAKRTIGERPYNVQLMAGIVLHRGEITEMKTGEGKTLAATMPVYLNALLGKGVHVVTDNDYLSKRDADWMGHIY